MIFLFEKGNIPAICICVDAYVAFVLIPSFSLWCIFSFFRIIMLCQIIMLATNVLFMKKYNYKELFVDGYNSTISVSGPWDGDKSCSKASRDWVASRLQNVAPSRPEGVCFYRLRHRERLPLLGRFLGEVPFALLVRSPCWVGPRYVSEGRRSFSS